MYYIIQLDGKKYANEELFNAAIAGGERSFIKMLARKEASARVLFDQLLYTLTPEQENTCRSLDPLDQDFDTFYRHLNVTTTATLQEIKDGVCTWLPGAVVVTLGDTVPMELYTYKRLTFLKSVEYKERKKKYMLPKMAAMKIFGRLYIALNAVDVRVDRPIIVTAKSS